MTLADMATSLGGPNTFIKRLWRQVAFLGRYGGQPANVCLAMPVDDMERLVSATATLLEEEHKKD